MLLVTAVACAGGPTALYPGPELPREAVALLEYGDWGHVRVLGIDGARTRGTSWLLAPGWHRVWIKAAMGGTAMNVSYQAWTYCTLVFEASAGGAYRVRSENERQFAGAGNASGTLGASVVDALGEVVSVLEGCSGQPPDFRKRD